MNFAIIIQARTGSKRFPKKILAKIDRRSVLEFLIDRLTQIFSKNKIIIATTKFKRDNIICNFSKKKKINFFRGHESNVLKRYLDCAKKFKVKNIIRITSDCPLVDPKLIQKMRKIFILNKLDYLANTNPSTRSRFPDGSDVEIFKFTALLKVSKLSNNDEDNEHVTSFFWKNPKKFKTKMINKKKDLSNYKFSIDYKSDLTLVKKILKKIKAEKSHGSAEEIVNIIKKNRYMKIISLRNKKRFLKNRKDLINVR